jgi:hypothetical protein
MVGSTWGYIWVRDFCTLRVSAKRLDNFGYLSHRVSLWPIIIPEGSEHSHSPIVNLGYNWVRY